MSTSDEVDRAFAFMRRGDIAGTREEPWRFGTAVFTPEVPLRHDSNYLFVERPAESAAELATEAERVQSQLSHRVVLVPSSGLGANLRPGFEKLGWRAEHSVVMVHRRAPERTPDTSLVQEVEAAALEPVWERFLADYAWATPAVIQQIIAARRLIPIQTRFFAVYRDGGPVSFTDLYVDGDSAQVEAVGTLEPYRGRGYARAVVWKAVEEARRAGAEFVFLVAHADDWPKEMYRRLGFDEVGDYYKFARSDGE
jgi:ribosomal protein S18 acetylase RimI-like enzyme